MSMHEQMDDKQKGWMMPMNNKSIVDKVIARITDAIFNGELLPGQKIPTEKELCENMQVGRNSVREAVKALETMGVLTIRRAEGTFVSDGFSNRMIDPMVYGLILEGGNSPAVIELRRLFEVGILKIAIEKASEADIKQMKEALKKLQIVIEEKQDINEILEADIVFHKALEDAVDNPLVDIISDVIERLTRVTRARAVEHFMQNNELQKMYDKHKQLLDIIVERDEKAVAQNVDEHFEYWKDELK